MAKIEVLENGNVRIRVQTIMTGNLNRKRIVTPDVKNDAPEPIIMALARAFRWQEYIDNGKFKNAAELSLAIGKEPGLVARTLRLTLLSPKIIGRIVSGDIPQGLTLAKLRQGIPELWTEQECMFL
jgi:hypothetical protein